MQLHHSFRFLLVLFAAQCPTTIEICNIQLFRTTKCLFFRQFLTNLYTLLKPGGQLIYTSLERLPVDEPYEKLDKTKWKKFQHSRVLSPFSKSENPFEEYRNLTKEVGFEEDVITLLEDLDMYFKNESITRCKIFFILLRK